MVHTQILVGAQNKVFWHSVADRFNQRFYSFVRGAGYNTHHISWDCSGTLNVGFCELACQKQKKINTGRAGAQVFVRIWVQHRVSQLTVTYYDFAWNE